MCITIRCCNNNTPCNSPSTSDLMATELVALQTQHHSHACAHAGNSHSQNHILVPTHPQVSAAGGNNGMLGGPAAPTVASVGATPIGAGAVSSSLSDQEVVAIKFCESSSGHRAFLVAEDTGCVLQRRGAWTLCKLLC